MINVDQLLATPGSLTGGRTYREVLAAARERISSPDRWTQGLYAVDAQGERVKPRDPSACCWCLLGALACESNIHGIIPPPLYTFLTEVMVFQYGSLNGKPVFDGLSAMNDYVTHTALMGFLDYALQQFPEESVGG
jgi:hypothetical protein